MDSAKDLFLSWWGSGEKPAKKTSTTTSKVPRTQPAAPTHEPTPHNPAASNSHANPTVQPVIEKKKKKTSAERYKFIFSMVWTSKFCVSVGAVSLTPLFSSQGSGI
jgi:hypothetical protein